MQGSLALARALACDAPRYRRQLIEAVAEDLAAGNTKAADELGRYLDRDAYAEARVQAAELRRKPVEQAVARVVARCFVMLRAVAFRLRLPGGGRR
jgi:hypothetical protein